MRQQTADARERERRTAALYRLSRELATRSTPDALVDAATATVSSVLDGPVAILLPRADGRLAAAGAGRERFQGESNELGAAQWVFDHKRPAGLGTDTLPAARWLYLPLEGTAGTVGVIAVSPPRRERLSDPRQFHWIETIANQVALALERGQLAVEAEGARVAVEAERLRNSLLSAVSHDLRTPLAVITGAATTLRDEPALTPDTRHELAATVAEEGERLNRLVANLLDMTRLESGAVAVKREWHSLEELVGAALARLEPRLAGRAIALHVPQDLPLVAIDGVLVEQALFNLVDNALKYSPPGASIEITAALSPRAVRLEVADCGPGIPPGQEAIVFEKFTRSPRPGDPGGIGLGLAIVKGIAEAHGGHVSVTNRAGGGATFALELPREGDAPALAPEAAP
jgi:two-component system sensor histidine kinase KdpD